MKGLVLIAMLAAPVWAQLQLSALDGLAAKAKESAEITLDQATLQLANGFLGQAKGKDAKAAELLSKVRAIQVRSYEFRKAGDYDAGVVPAIRAQLQAQGWTKFVDLNESGGRETFQLYSRSQNGRNTGFAMVAAESNALAVIYIDGEISLADLAGLGGQFGIPNLPGAVKDAGKADKKGKE